MEIRIENKISIEELNELKETLNSFFNIDFSITLDYNYCYLRDR